MPHVSAARQPADGVRFAPSTFMNHAKARENRPEDRPDNPDAKEPRPGISNRESADEEAAERESNPPVDTQPLPEDAAGRVGDATGLDLGGQTSHKAGSKSIAQKEAGSRYPDRSMPASRKVSGAFGKEPDESDETPS
jgi:hypothetical protein